ncbi:sensor histidine kinase [Cohnella hashimotonis]|uniref:histidine kinase n=1 Tax=Cohnella hashimotonis TaxID=2826895 RepID=A0ABT6TU77_9BACL|nr:histidine kinase [Cohnella hashimotonis]MDI4649855.1 histidine kinase [Cohnella hashimotonis]
MMSVYGKFGLYLALGIRWMLFAIGLILYAGQTEPGSASVIGAAALLQAVCACLWLSKLKSRASAAVVCADLLFQPILLYAAGGLTGPFVFYSLSGLALLKPFMRWTAFYAATLLYLIALPVPLALLGGTAANEYASARQVYFTYLLLFYATAIIVHAMRKGWTAHLRKLTAIYASPRLAVADAGPWTAARHAEDLLKRLLGRQGVWLCVGASVGSDPNPSWIHAYYANTIARNPPAADKTYAKIVTPLGETASLYVRTLRDRRGDAYGWLLIEAEQEGLSVIQKVYLRLVMMKFEADYDLNRGLGTMRDRAIAAERSAVAQKIHDGIAQELFFCSVQLYQLRSALQKDDSGQAIRLVTQIEKKVKDSHRDVRGLIEELKGEKRRFNLLDAIEKMLRRITDRTGVTLVFENAGRAPQERIELEEAIYHFIEEAANNVIKHAEAGRLRVRLEVTSVQWTILVEDDGKGIRQDAESAAAGKHGLRGMASRIQGLNGTFSIAAGNPAGTTIMAAIPRERSMAHA